jgi:hypothetical protein
MLHAESCNKQQNGEKKRATTKKTKKQKQNYNKTHGKGQGKGAAWDVGISCQHDQYGPPPPPASSDEIVEVQQEPTVLKAPASQHNTTQHNTN